MPRPARLAAVRCLLLLVVAGGGLKTRVWSFAAPSPTASNEIAFATPSFIGENHDALNRLTNLASAKQLTGLANYAKRA